MLDLNTIHEGDCLQLMRHIPSGSVDMILCDLPYGTTACKWDAIIPFDKLWSQYERVIKPNGAIVLTAAQPFTSLLISSNMALFKYCWYWKKNRVGGFTSAKLKPLKVVEDICVFSKGKTANRHPHNMAYYPQGLVYAPKITRSSNDTSPTGYKRPSQQATYTQEYTNYPKEILEFGHDLNRLHPTQKPVALFEYLIRTYTNPGEVVLDNCAGSFTTAVAAENTGRRWICIEQEAKYCEIGRARLAALQPQLALC